jgi:hypothetical protein
VLNVPRRVVHSPYTLLNCSWQIGTMPLANAEEPYS